MNISKEINQMIFQMTEHSLESVDNLLCTYLAICDDEEDFETRMKCVCHTKSDGKTIKQYFFDESPAFYTVLNIENNSWTFQVVHGKNNYLCNILRI